MSLVYCIIPIISGPRYAILDECTSAVSEEVEGTIYSLCKQLRVTIFTVSHRASLQVYHDYQLRYEEVEGTIYSLCKQLRVTMFTVSHRASLQFYHDYQLRYELSS